MLDPGSFQLPMYEKTHALGASSSCGPLPFRSHSRRDEPTLQTTLDLDTAHAEQIHCIRALQEQTDRLQDRAAQSLEPRLSSISQPEVVGNHCIKDNQMQLMLLEQQQDERKMLTMKEQAQEKNYKAMRETFAVREPFAGDMAGPADRALQEYQTQLMLLEQQNKKRLLMRLGRQPCACDLDAQHSSPVLSTQLELSAHLSKVRRDSFEQKQEIIEPPSNCSSQHDQTQLILPVQQNKRPRKMTIEWDRGEAEPKAKQGLAHRSPPSRAQKRAERWARHTKGQSRDVLKQEVGSAASELNDVGRLHIELRIQEEGHD